MNRFNVIRHAYDATTPSAAQQQIKELFAWLSDHPGQSAHQEYRDREISLARWIDVAYTEESIAKVVRDREACGVERNPVFPHNAPHFRLHVAQKRFATSNDSQETQER